MHALEFVLLYEPPSGLYDLAAVVMCRLILNHPFIDGNKRTAVKAALVFLVLSGVALRDQEASLAELEELAVNCARRACGEADVARMLRGWLSAPLP